MGAVVLVKCTHEPLITEPRHCCTRKLTFGLDSFWGSEAVGRRSYFQLDRSVRAVGKGTRYASTLCAVLTVKNVLLKAAIDAFANTSVGCAG